MSHIRTAAVMALMGVALSGPALLSLGVAVALAQRDDVTRSLNDAAQVQPHNVTVTAVNYRGSDALEVRLTGPYRGPDTDTFPFVPGLAFPDGPIETDSPRTPPPSALPG